jgi:glycolate oxidase FAD binding subunit
MAAGWPCPVRAGTAADAVVGVVPGQVAQPATVDEVAALLRVAAGRSLSVLARGAGSRLGWGSPPRTCDLLVDLRGLDRIIEHAAGDMVVRVEAGVPLARLAERVAREGQQLAIDPPDYDDGRRDGVGDGFSDGRDGGTEDGRDDGPAPVGTVGGALAVGVGGPRRLRYGRPRDLLLGVTIVRADGVVAVSGGRVVKNVAGYDLGKLVCGSYGQLGLIVSATLRLHPLPAVTRYLSVALPDPAAAAAASAALLGSQLAPSAVEVDAPGPGTPVTLAALFEGTSDGIATRVTRAAELVAASAAGVGEVRVGERPPPWFGWLPGGRAGTLVELTVAPAALAGALELVATAARAGGLVAPVRGSTGVATLAVGLAASASPQSVASFVSAVRAGLVTHGGFAVVRHAPAAVRATVDPWGPVDPGALALMRRVKEQFDPEHRLAPGRFVGDS